MYTTQTERALGKGRNKKDGPRERMLDPIRFRFEDKIDAERDRLTDNLYSNRLKSARKNAANLVAMLNVEIARR